MKAKKQQQEEISQSEEKWYKSFIPYLEYINVSMGIGLFIVSIFGYFMVKAELHAFRVQNDILSTEMDIIEADFLESQRPYGVVKYAAKEDSIIFGSYNIETQNDTTYYQFRAKMEIINKGKGVLRYIGAITYPSQKQFDIRSKILESSIDTLKVEFDTFAQFMRDSVLSTNEHNTFPLHWKHIDYFKGSFRFLYSVYFYKDLLGNLYDTVFLTTIRSYSDTPFYFDSAAIYGTGNYYKYTAEEARKIYRFFVGVNHPMQEFFKEYDVSITVEKDK